MMKTDIDKKVLKLLKILRENPKKRFSEKEILKKGFSKQDLDDIEEIYIIRNLGPHPFSRIKVTKDITNWIYEIGGNQLIEKLQNKEILDNQTKISKKLFGASIASVCVAVLLVGATVYIGINSIKISNQQTKILDKTSQPIRADLFLSSTQFLNRFIIGSYKHHIDIGVHNLGKSLAPDIAIYLDDEGEFVGNTLEGNPYYLVKNLKSTDFNETTFEFWINPNSLNNISEGKYNLTFIVECPFCETPKEKQSVQICLYNKNSSKCLD